MGNQKYELLVLIPLGRSFTLSLLFRWLLTVSRDKVGEKGIVGK